MSDELVEVLLGKLLEALRPASLEAIEEPTVNAALAIIDSMHPQSELEALLAVQIIATGFSLPHCPSRRLRPQRAWSRPAYSAPSNPGA
jgi:hypothetical protein